MLRASIVVVLCALTVVRSVGANENSKYSVLAIAYFGALDKPISQIVISDSYGEAKRYRNAMMQKDSWDLWDLAYLHVLSPAILGRLIATVESNEGGVQPEPGKQYIYNGVSMTIVTPQGRKTVFFHIESAMPLLDQLESMCKENKSLRSHLVHFQEQVRRWGGPSPPQPVRQYKP
jgi:hypothetical protein